MEKTKRPTLAFGCSVLGGLLLYYAMIWLQPALPRILFDYQYWLDQMITSPLMKFYWMVGDMTEPFFFKSLLGGVGLLIGSLLAYQLDKRKSRYRLTPITYGYGKLWPWLFAASFLSLLIVTVLFGNIRSEEPGWVATFIPYVSIAGAVILKYGGNMKSLLTGSILGALFSTPIAMFIRSICLANGLPGVIGSVSGMWIGGIIVLQTCFYLPWMSLVESAPNSTVIPGEMTIAQLKKASPNRFFIRRLLADYSEPMFVGNEYAGLFLIIGSLLSWSLNPYHVSYGTGLFPGILLAGWLSGAMAIYLYWDRWMEQDFFPSFVGIVSAAPQLVLKFGSSIWIIVFTAVLAAIICPPIAEYVNSRLPKHWHGMIGFTFSMALGTVVITLVLRYLQMNFPFLF